MRWPSPPTCRRSPRPRRRATARCARGWSRSGRSAAPSIPTGGTRRCRRSAIRDAWLAIVGLAPGKHGANRTGRPFTGDYAGELLYATLLKFGLAEGEYRADPADGLQLKGAIILNAVKCLPPRTSPSRARSRPAAIISRTALATLTNVRVVIALGQIAHVAAARALGLPPSSTKFGHGAEHVAPDGRILLSSYHCSRYNQNTRTARRGDVRKRVRAGAAVTMTRINDRRVRFRDLQLRGWALRYLCGAALRAQEVHVEFGKLCTDCSPDMSSFTHGL